MAAAGEEVDFDGLVRAFGGEGELMDHMLMTAKPRGEKKHTSLLEELQLSRKELEEKNAALLRDKETKDKQRKMLFLQQVELGREPEEGDEWQTPTAVQESDDDDDDHAYKAGPDDPYQ